MKLIQSVLRPRQSLWATACALLSCTTLACRQTNDNAPLPAPQAEASASIRLHLTIANKYIAAPVIDAFERKAGISVEIIEDAGVTPDVYWADNPYDLVRLARSGELAPVESETLAEWPAPWRDAESRWFAFAARGRAAVFNTDIIPPSGAPAQIIDLLDPRFIGKVAMAHPESASAGHHLAALLHIWGEEVYRAWLADMKEVGVVLLEDDAAVVEAVGAGDAVVGLADSDVAQLAIARGLPIGLSLIGHTNSFGAAFSTVDLTYDGPMVIPSAVGVSVSAADPQSVHKFIEFVLSTHSGRLLAAGDARLMPVRSELRDAYPDRRLPSNAYTRKFEDFGAIEAHIQSAVAIAIEALDE